MIHIEIAAERLFEVFGLSVTNTLLMSWIVVALLTVLAVASFRKLHLVPPLIQNLLEIVIEGFLGIMGGMFGSREKSEKYFPVVATIFLFVLLSNWLGIVPGIGSIGFYEIKGGERVFVPLLRSGASDLNFTLALGVSAIFLVNFFGIAALGIFKHGSKFFTFRNPIDFFVGILELVSEIAKMISFTFRLFGNVFAGEVLLIIMAFLAPYLIPVPFLALEIFVGFIQALVFAMLTMVFIANAVAEEH